MPYVYIGRRNFYLGKTLWEIVGNLKNFGVGRILVRSKFERYPEVSFVRILRAEPLMDEENKFGRVWVDKVFRGRSFGEYELSKTAYKNDFKLVPKDEEEFYTSKVLAPEVVESMKTPVPEFLEFPPLLKELIKKESKVDNPLLKAVYKLGPDNMARVVPGEVCKKAIRDDSKAPHLYADIKMPSN